MIIPKDKVCPVLPAGTLCVGNICAWYVEGKGKCAIALLVEDKPAPKKKATSSKTSAT